MPRCVQIFFTNKRLKYFVTQVSVFSENGTTYFYQPEEGMSSQLSTGVIPGGSVLLPQWSAYSGTPAHIVAMKVRNSAPNFVQEK